MTLQGDRVTRALRAAAMELCPQVRQLLVEVPAGGEELQRELSREFGLPVVEGGPERQTHLTLCFSPSGRVGRGRIADLSGETPALAEYRFSLREGALPGDAAALPLLSALWASGRLERSDIAVSPHFHT